MGEPKPWRAEVLGELKLWGALIRESTGKKEDKSLYGLSHDLIAP